MEDTLATGSVIIELKSIFDSLKLYFNSLIGDNQATYTDMHRSIIGMIEFSMFGIPYTGNYNIKSQNQI